MGAREQNGDAIALCGARARKSGDERVPAAELRTPGVPRDAGGCSPARISRQGARLLQLALHRQVRLLDCGRHRTDIYPGSEVGLDETSRAERYLAYAFRTTKTSPP